MNQYNKAITVNYNKKCEDIIIKPLKIYIIQTVFFILLIRKQDHKIFVITIENIKKVLKPKQYINPQPFIPEEYYNIINKFKKRFIDQLFLY